MLASLSLKGYFYLPENPNEQIAGILKFNQGEGIILDLFGQFSNFNNPSSTENNIVLGLSSDGKKITLLNCYIHSKHMSFPGLPMSELSVMYLFIGHHFRYPNDIVFDYCSIEYLDFNLWLGISGFSVPEFDKENNEITLRYKQPDKIISKLIDELEIVIEFNYSRPGNYFAPINQATIEQNPTLIFRPKEKASFLHFLEKYLVFTKFLALCYFSYPQIKSVWFSMEAKKEDEFDTGYNNVELFYNGGIDPIKYRKHDHKHNFLLQYKDCEMNFLPIMQNWYILTKKIEASIDILTESFMNRGSTAEFRFLSLVQSLENMHRRLGDNRKVTLKTRLSEIIDSIPSEVKLALLRNEGDFVNRVTLNRNFYTHYDEEKEKRAATMGELYILSEKLKIVLVVYVLKELSFSGEQIKQVIMTKGAFLFNHVIDTKLSETEYKDE